MASTAARQPLLMGPEKSEEDLLSKLKPSQMHDVKRAMHDASEGTSVKNFRKHLQTSARTATFCLICALPVLIPDLITDTAWVAGFQCMVQFVVFTNYQDLGTTTQFAYQGVIGTFWAVAFSHVMNGIMPGGAKGDHFMPWVAHGSNIIFIVSVLAMDLSKNVRMFLLSYHCFFHMDLVNPAATGIYNVGWGIETDGYPFVTMICCCCGVTMSVISMLVPFPNLATRCARQSTISSVTSLNTLMMDMHRYFSRSGPSCEIFRTKKQLDEIRDFVSVTEAHLAGSWWEAAFVDFGKWGVGSKIRQLLARHMVLMEKMSDNADSLFACISLEGFEEPHGQCMKGVQDPTYALLSSTRDLLMKATLAATDGDITRVETNELYHLIARVRTNMEELAKVFYQVRQTVSPQMVINPSLKSENFYLYGITIYARYAVDYAECLLHCPVQAPSIFQILVNGAKSVFNMDKILHDYDYRSFIIRSTLSVVVCFYLGVFVFGYDGTTAGTVSLLLSNFAGSALLRNLGRLQGVVLGNILPHILMQMTGSDCWAPRIIVQGALLVAYMLLTNYIYYASATMGFIGGLAAAFGGPILVFTCSNQDAAAVAAAEQAFQIGSYKKILQCTTCCLVLVIVDLFLASERASTKATDQVCRALVRIDGAINAIFLKRNPDGTVEGAPVKNRYYGKMKFHDKIAAVKVIDAAERSPGRILGLLGSAEELGAEADKENRTYRAPWPTALFGKVIHYGRELRDDIVIIENALAGSDDDYDDIFGKVRSLSTFRSLYEDLMSLLDEALTMIQIVLNNETGGNQRKLVQGLLDKGIGSLEGMPQLYAEVNANFTYPQSPQMAAKTLEDDELCRLQVILTLLENSASAAVKMVQDSIMAA